MAAVARTEIYGPFEMLERLGAGGTATVHRAIERSRAGLERVVAVKRLLPHLADDEEFVRSFVREARAASSLQHDNIVRIYEIGRVAASYFVSMEYVAGRDLRLILRQARRVSGPPPIGVVLALLIELVDALDHAHEHLGADGVKLAVLHGGMSPSNLIVSHAGHLKVTDFGIAGAGIDYLMEHGGRMGGKLPYIAPELLAGRPAGVPPDGRPDLFSASVIAYELLSAAPLFAARDDAQTMHRLKTMQPLPPSARNPACPPELDDIVLRGLGTDPDRRWRTAAEMRVALAELAIDRVMPASDREVSDWVEQSFEMLAPSRLRLPLAPPPGGPPPAARPSPPRSDPDDEIVDRVWGGTTPRSSVPYVVDELPELTGPFSQLVPWQAGVATLAPAPTVAAMATAPGTGAMDRASPPRRSSMLPLMLAAVAVAAAGAGIGWLMARRNRPAHVPAVPPPIRGEAPTAPKGSAVSPRAPGPAATLVVPDSTAQPASLGGGDGRAGDHAADGVPALDSVSHDGVDDSRRRAARKQRSRPGRAAMDRSHGPGRWRRQDGPSGGEDAGAGTGAEVLEAGPDDEPSGDRVVIHGASAAVRPSPAGPVEARPAAGTSREPSAEPEGEPAHPRPLDLSRPNADRGPVIVSASRARLASGSVRPVRLPPGEQPPPRIVAKLCTDPTGGVASVTVLSSVSPAVRNAVERAMAQWRYEPIVEDDEPVSACFASAFPVLFE